MNSSGTSSHFFIRRNFNRDRNPDLAFPGRGQGLSFRLGTGDGGFGPETSYAIGGQDASDLTIGDFNEDGYLDVAAVSELGEVLAVLLGDGSGGFAAPIITPLPGFPSRIVSGSFRAGGHLDLAVTLVGPRSLALFFGAGDGSFTTGPRLPTVEAPLVLTAADVDGDGKLDLAVGGSGFTLSPQTPGMALYQGRGDGNFDLRRVLPLFVGNRIEVSDVDLDGLRDLIYLGSGGLSVLPGRGNWEFGLPRETGIYGSDLRLADFDGDGYLDAAISNGEGFRSWIGILRGTSGGFEGLSSIPVPGSPPFELRRGDFNGDGRSDVAALSKNFFSGGPVSIFFSDGQSIGPPVLLPGTDNAVGLAVGSLNSDAMTDLVVAAGADLMVFLGSPVAPVLHQTIAGATGSALTIADFNGDGKQDLAVRTPDMTSVRVFFGDGTGNLVEGAPVTGFPSANSLQAADFNGDGRADLLIDGAIFRGNADGSFSSASFPPLPTGSDVVLADDLDGDGRADLIAHAIEGLWLLTSNGPGFQAPLLLFPMSAVTSISAADVTGDGKKDLILARNFDSLVTVLALDGASYAATHYATGRGGGGAVAADLDGDGRSEILVPGSLPSRISILRNTNCVPDRLGVSTSPSACNVPGSPLAIQPVVSVYDDGDDVVACAGGSVTAALAPTPPGATLGGTTTRAVSSGSAAFTNLSVSPAGSDYRLLFAHPLAGSTSSRLFTAGLSVSIAGPASLCSNASATYSAAAGFSVYEWRLDGVLLSRRSTAVVSSHAAPGPHTLTLTATRDTCAVSDSFAISVPALPSVSAPSPAAIRFSNGDTLVLSVTASGSGTLVYRWRRNGVPLADGGRVSGAATPTLTITSARTGDEGRYDVTVTDPCGIVATSAAATVAEAGASTAVYLKADGSVYAGKTALARAAGVDQHAWFKTRFAGLHSYEIEVLAAGIANQTVRPRLSIAFLDDTASGPFSKSSLVADVSASEPPSSGCSGVYGGQCFGGSRYSLKNDATDAAAVLRVDPNLSANGDSVAFSIRVTDTTLRSPWFFLAGDYNTFVIVTNTNGTAVHGLVHFWAPTGALLGTAAVDLPANSTVAVSGREAAPATSSGSISLEHDGPDGAVTASATTLSATTGLSFDSPFVSVRGPKLGR